MSRRGHSFHWTTKVSLLACMAVARWSISWGDEPNATRAPLPPRTLQVSRSSGLDELLGRDGRKRHEMRVAGLRIGERTFDWSQYSAWGRELFENGSVTNPPIGPSPSKVLSDHYRCVHCHNASREDPHLTIQDPEARVPWIERRNQSAKSPSEKLWLAPGTTLWGAVNRESFYNDAYEVYHFLTLENNREMNARSLEDATQICCRYCSVGRLAEPWEIVSLLTYFWDLEVRLSDLNLPNAVEQAVLTSLREAQDPAERNQTREFLRRQYLTKAGDLFTSPPSEWGEGTAGPYPDKLAFRGDPKIGAKLYELACTQCHGEGKPNERQGAPLVQDLKRFHAILSKGTSHDDEPYMPMFTAQRLSRQQIADIQAYLQGLANAP